MDFVSGRAGGEAGKRLRGTKLGLGGMSGSLSQTGVKAKVETAGEGRPGTSGQSKEGIGPERGRGAEGKSGR